MITVSDYLKNKYGCKVYKLSLQTGCTCPNRDGTKGTGGCIFCSEGGSGDFAAPLLPIDEQIELAKRRVDDKFPKGTSDRRYIAYFQSFTNTYGSVKELEPLFMQALSHDEIVGISIATRPDCLPDDIMDMLIRLNAVKPVWVELGLQTSSEETARLINRCYTLKEFENGYRRLKENGIYTIIHMIVALPGETEEIILNTARYIGSLSPLPDGVKIQLLHVLRGTKLAQMYEDNPFDLPTLEEYCGIVRKILDILPESITIHRLTGDGPKRLLVAPLWSADKKKVINTMRSVITVSDPLSGS
ncbi:MAG: TIGR01212 family radical SAM protein [Lachnospiraceae bacterium]|nr:TIGR01212 family radical SAM protein [Lachnospiraceae bacterium]